MRAATRLGLAALVTTAALVVAGCSGGDAASGGPTPSNSSPRAGADGGFMVTSPDFTAGGALPDSARASAFGGQCTGDNVSPALAWTHAPEGTESFAILMVDLDAGNFLHWSHADIPATVTQVDTGGAESLAGVGGHLAVADGSYFGPCPPDPDHHYVFTVYALDATLGLEPDYGVGDLRDALETHTLAEASIVGIAGP